MGIKKIKTNSIMTNKTIDIKLTETKSKGGWIVPVLSLIILAGAFYWGYKTYPKRNPCPVIEHDTTYVYDTVTYTITNEKNHYIQKLDTIIKSDTILAEVDTAEILNLYFSTFQYTRTWQDTNLLVVLEDRVTQNKPIANSFDYTIKRPQTVIQNIDNSIIYSKYLYAGGSVVFPDAKYSSIGLFYASKRNVFGIGYIPFQKGVQLTGGFTLFKIK